MMAEKLLEKDAATIIKKLVEKAKNGEPWAIRSAADRIIPPARDRATPFNLPPINSPAYLPRAVQAAIDAAAKGELSLEAASQVVALLTGLRVAYASADLAERMNEMEARLAVLTATTGPMTVKSQTEQPRAPGRDSATAALRRSRKLLKRR